MTSSDPRFSGRVTLPVEEGMDDELAAIIDRLGADAVRNSDGTWLPKIVSNLGTKVYSTRFCARGDEAWALDHLDEHVSLYLCSCPSSRAPCRRCAPRRQRCRTRPAGALGWLRCSSHRLPR